MVCCTGSSSGSTKVLEVRRLSGNKIVIKVAE